MPALKIQSSYNSVPSKKKYGEVVYISVSFGLSGRKIVPQNLPYVSLAGTGSHHSSPLHLSKVKRKGFDMTDSDEQSSFSEVQSTTATHLNEIRTLRIRRKELVLFRKPSACYRNMTHKYFVRLELMRMKVHFVNYKSVYSLKLLYLS